MFKHVFLVGIGGVSMSGIARILVGMGIKVSGSDIVQSVETDKLKQEGIEVFIGHNKKNLAADVDLIVVSAAIDNDNPEVNEAKTRDIPIWRRLQLINYLVDEKILVAVAGMHGKTTVSAMIATVCFQTNEDPTVMVGGEVRAIANNARVGQGELWILEACEYKKSFLDLKPNLAVITNIEEEHLDIYKDIEDILDTFGLFVEQVDRDGLIVACLDDNNVGKAIARAKANVAGYGFNQRPKHFSGVYWQIKNYRQENHKFLFDLYVDSEFYDSFSLMIPGEFNVLNAVATIITADFLVIDKDKVKQSLADFLGAKRRFDVLLESKKITVIDDYGHHPTEIKNFLQAVKEKYKDKKIWVVWQPHQYSRTWHFLDDFAKCFEGVDKLIVTEIYEARDSGKVKEEMNVKKLIKAIGDNNIDVDYMATYDKVAKYLSKNYLSGSVVVSLGAGPVDEVAHTFIKSISRK